VENYFNYFTEIEEHFCRRRGTLLTVSTLDWALMEMWKDAGIPLEAVLRGIDATFDHYESRPRRGEFKKINGLAWCAQEVLTAAEEMKEAAIGADPKPAKAVPGMGHAEIAGFAARNAALLEKVLRTASEPLRSAAGECAAALNEMAAAEGDLASLGAAAKAPPRLEDLERRLIVLEEKLLAALTVTTPQSDLLLVHQEADREIMPYRSKMPGFQIEQLRKQFIHKRLFERAKIPRLSLFYL
jgi:hypothetical protein